MLQDGLLLFNSERPGAAESRGAAEAAERRKSLATAEGRGFNSR